MASATTVETSAPSISRLVQARATLNSYCPTWDTAKKTALVVLGAGLLAAATYFGGPFASASLNLNPMAGYAAVAGGTLVLAGLIEAIRRFINRPAAPVPAAPAETVQTTTTRRNSVVEANVPTNAAPAAVEANVPADAAPAAEAEANV